MIKFVTAVISWFLIPLAMIVVAWDIARAFVEDKIVDK